MDRRRFLLISLAGALVAPLTAGAQVTGRIPRVGVLADGPQLPVFDARLAELGYCEGHNVEILRRYHGGVPARVAAAADELVALKPDVIAALGPPAAFAVQKLTRTIPIVFWAVGQPVEVGLITNLARPGANITGISFDVSAEFNAKQLQLMRDLLQKGEGLRLAVLWKPDPWTDPYVQETQRAANAMRMKLQFTPVREASELETAVSEAARRGNHGLVVLADMLSFLHRQRLAALAATHRLPAIYGFRESVEAGGLMSYAVNLRWLARRAADYVDKILKGAKPGDLPVEQPTKFEFVINLKTAKALGLTIPPSLLGRAG